MISKRTAVILIIAIVVIISIETKFGLDKINSIEDTLDHTAAQITLTADGKLIDLEGIQIKYEYDGAEKPLTTKLSSINDTGYENLQNNSAAFKPCAKGSNKLTFTIPKELIPEYDNELTVNFGYDGNTSDFNNYSLVINLTPMDEDNIKAAVTQTVYYPDENGETQQKQSKTSSVIKSSSSNVNCIIQ